MVVAGVDELGLAAQYGEGSRGPPDAIGAAADLPNLVCAYTDRFIFYKHLIKYFSIIELVEKHSSVVINSSAS